LGGTDLLANYFLMNFLMIMALVSAPSTLPMAWMGATEKLPLNFVLKRDVIAPIAGDHF